MVPWNAIALTPQVQASWASAAGSAPPCFGSSPGAGGSHPNSGKKRPNAFDKGKGKGGAQDKGKKPFRPTHTFWEYNDPKTQSFWVRDMTLDQIKQLKGKCLLCKSEKHQLFNCPKREEAYKNKQFYAYTRQKK